MEVDYPYHDIVANGRLIAETMLDCRTEEDRANAKLIAASPELFLACQRMVAMFWGDYPEKLRQAFRRDYPEHGVCQAEAAISKAEGKQ
ncbi:MAG TPA: hypothetical protein VFC07_05985 [Verrucomicrobiae bacterium]|nr:hypothetical protein [Verrucomicrobiae bacterium]